MKKTLQITLILAILAALSLPGLYAQETNEPALQKDVQKNTQELKKLQRQTDEVNKAAERRAKAAEDAAKKRADDTVGAVNTRQAKTDEKINASRQDLGNKMLLGFGIVVLILGLLGVMIYRKMKQTQVITVALGSPPTIEPVQPSKTHTGILRNPNRDELKKFSAKNGNLKEIPFFLVLDESHEYLCKAYLSEDEKQEILVSVGDDPEKVGWNYRRKRAAHLYDLTRQ